MTRGGRIYGKGAKGLVMDTKCDVTDNETLCKKLESPQIDTLTLYGFDAKREITSRDDITKFKDQVLSIDNLVHTFPRFPKYISVLAKTHLFLAVFKAR